MKKLTSVLSLFVLAIVLSISTHAQSCLTSGCLDDTFGTGGEVMTSLNFGTGNNLAHAVAIQTDGKIVVAADAANYPSGTGHDFYVLRYNPDGSLDYTFGSSGVTQISFSSAADNEEASAVAIQTDGKIVVGGSIPANGSLPAGFGVARLNSDGSIDTSFGTNGKITFNFTGTEGAFLNALAIQANGYIVAGGRSAFKFAFARLTPAGAFDSSFNGSGRLTVQTAVSNTTLGGAGCNALTIQPDGKIIGAGNRPSFKVTGRDKGTGSGDFATVRLNTNGTLDASFGSGGAAYLDFFGQSDNAHGVAIDSSGRIIVGGYASPDGRNGRMALARYLANGTLDPSFGTGGKVAGAITDTSQGIDGIAIQSDGKIIGIGGNGTIDFYVTRFNSSGSVDTTFGANGTGFVTTDFNGLTDGARALAMQPADGKYLLVGGASGDTYIGIARYLP